MQSSILLTILLQLSAQDILSSGVLTHNLVNLVYFKERESRQALLASLMMTRVYVTLEDVTAKFMYGLQESYNKQ